jgi:hypothetical protein
MKNWSSLQEQHETYQAARFTQKAHVNAEVDMAFHIHDNLRSLDTYMCTTANSNISDFNDYICNQMAKLSGHGKAIHDLLFKACTRVNCEKFCDFVKDTHQDWECNHCVYEPEIIMNKCINEYSCILLLSWGAHTKQEQIITLQAKPRLPGLMTSAHQHSGQYMQCTTPSLLSSWQRYQIHFCLELRHERAS